MGFPIRKFTDQRLLPPPRDLSQGATSFIAFLCQGIHRMPLRRLFEENRRTQGKAPPQPNGFDIFSQDPTLAGALASRRLSSGFDVYETIPVSMRSLFVRPLRDAASAGRATRSRICGDLMEHGETNPRGEAVSPRG